MMNHKTIIKNLLKALYPLSFSLPVTHVYNPLEYASAPYMKYLGKFGQSPREVLLVGMNPGPYGMAQTGVPFGEVEMVSRWMGICEKVGKPKKIHPKRPIDGFNCKRSEVSGKRLWGWARKNFKTPERFFKRFFVANYCPLVFMEESGRNRTPNNLPVSERKLLFEACDRALQHTVDYFSPAFVVGIGKFAEDRARDALSGFDGTIGRITHPSPANPKANKGWDRVIESELKELGVI